MLAVRAKVQETKEDVFLSKNLTDFYIEPDKLVGLDFAKKVAYGYSATVHQATYNNKLAAVKVFRMDGFTPLLALEIDALTQLSLHPHKNITQFYGFSTSASTPLFVFEWIEGNSLSANLCGTSPQNPVRIYLSQPAQFAKFLLGIAEGIAQLHRYNIIWVDGAPRNILVDKAMNPKLIDFGYSIFLRKDNVYKWREPAVLENESAPECCNAAPAYSFAADVWRFGLMLTEIITYLKDAAAAENIIYFDGKVTISDELKKDLSPWVVDLICACMQTKPEDRPTMNAIIKKLKAVLETKVDNNPHAQESVNTLTTHLAKYYLNPLDLKDQKKIEKGNSNFLTAQYRQHTVCFRTKNPFVRTNQDLDVLMLKFDVLSTLENYPHPNIASFFGICFDPRIDGPLMIKEYLGSDIVTRVRLPKEQNDPLIKYLEDPNHFLVFMLGIAKCLQHIHHHQIVVRYLSLFKFAVDQTMQPKLMDLDYAFFPHLTIRPHLGSGPCDAPESFRRRNPEYTFASDIWSFGIMLGELHSIINKQNYDPYPGNDDPYDSVAEGKLAPLLPEGLDPDLESIVKQCLSFNPKDRPTAEQISAKLLAKSNMFKSAEKQTTEVTPTLKFGTLNRTN